MENLPQRPLTPQEKKQYLLNKYVKRDYKVEDLVPKYAVYFNPAIDKINEWTLVCVCNDKNQALGEILWRKKYMEYGDGDLIIDNDPQFKTWRNELTNIDPSTGQPYEPGESLMKVDYNSSGNMMQVISNSLPEQQKNGYRGLVHYTGIEIGNYEGSYKIEEIYEI